MTTSRKRRVPNVVVPIRPDVAPRKPPRRSGPSGVARLGGAEDLAACHRAIDLVNRHPALWPDLFRMTEDGRPDWRAVERNLIALSDRPTAPARTRHRAARTAPLS
jgi:hypothetical protein